MLVARISSRDEGVVEEHPWINAARFNARRGIFSFFFFFAWKEKNFLSNPAIGHENLIPRETTPFISTPRFREATLLFRYHFAALLVSLSFSSPFFFLPSLFFFFLSFFLLWNSLSTIRDLHTPCFNEHFLFARRKERKKKKGGRGNEAI